MVRITKKIKISIKPKYSPIAEKPYCCVPAVFQMVLKRRGVKYPSQDEIGYELGLVVPKNKAHFFSKVRIGKKKPRAGWGTRIKKKEYAPNKFFKKYKIPLKENYFKLNGIKDFKKFIVENLENNNDVIVCFNNKALYGKGNYGHVSLIQSFENSNIILVDPEKNVPKFRNVKLQRLIKAIKIHEADKRGGFWVISKNNAKNNAKN